MQRRQYKSCGWRNPSGEKKDSCRVIGWLWWFIIFRYQKSGISCLKVSARGRGYCQGREAESGSSGCSPGLDHGYWRRGPSDVSAVCLPNCINVELPEIFKLWELVLESQVFVLNHIQYLHLLLKTCLILVQVWIWYEENYLNPLP